MFSNSWEVNKICCTIGVFLMAGLPLTYDFKFPWLFPNLSPFFPDQLNIEKLRSQNVFRAPPPPPPPCPPPKVFVQKPTCAANTDFLSRSLSLCLGDLDLSLCLRLCDLSLLRLLRRSRLLLRFFLCEWNDQTWIYTYEFKNVNALKT